MAQLKIDKTTFAMLASLTNSAGILVASITPTDPISTAVKVFAFGAWNTILVWIGIEEGDLPATTSVGPVPLPTPA